MSSTAKKPAVVEQPVQPNIITAGDLIPGIDPTIVEPTRFWFWAGVVDEGAQTYGRYALTVGGVAFQYRPELRGKRNGERVSIPIIGHLMRLSRDEVRDLAAKIRTKFLRPAGRAEGDRNRQVYVDMETTTPAELEERKAKGLPVITIAFSEGDVPYARLVFLQHVPTGQQKLYRPGERAVPPAIAETGIVLPPDDAEPASSDPQAGVDTASFFAS